MKPLSNLFFILFTLLLIFPSPSKCSECPKGKFFSNNECEDCLWNCEYCLDPVLCVKCFPGYGVSEHRCVTECPREEYALIAADTPKCVFVDFEKFTTVWSQSQGNLPYNHFGLEVEDNMKEFSFCLWYKVLDQVSGIDVLTFTKHNSFSEATWDSQSLLSFKAYFTSESILMIGTSEYQVTNQNTKQNQWARLCTTMNEESLTSYYLFESSINTVVFPLEKPYESGQPLPPGKLFVQIGPKFLLNYDKVQVKNLKLIKGRLISKYEIMNGFEQITHYYLFENKAMDDKVTKKKEIPKNDLSILEDRKALHFERNSYLNIDLNLKDDHTIQFELHLLSFPYQMIDTCQIFKIKNNYGGIITIGLRYDDQKNRMETRLNIYSAVSKWNSFEEFVQFSNKTIAFRKTDPGSFSVIYENNILPTLSEEVTITFGADLNIPSCNFYITNLLTADGSPGTYQLQNSNCLRYDMATDRCLQCYNSMLNFDTGVCEGSCPANCERCYSENICEVCSTGFFLDKGKCVLNCPSNQVIFGAQCLPLIPHCASYDKNKKCTACEPGYQNHQFGCIPNCDKTHCAEWRQAKEEFECKSCPIKNCQVYLEDHKCLLCNEGWYNHKGECVSTCPDGVDKVHEAACLESCPMGFFFDPKIGQCRKCSDDCQECTSLLYCTGCGKSAFNYQGHCLASCPLKTYIHKDGRRCADCPSECGMCRYVHESARIECATCADNYFLSHGGTCVKECPGELSYKFEFEKGKFQCVSACPDYSVIDENKKICAFCPQDCLDCDETGYCLECDNSIQRTLLHEGKCVSKCPSGYHRALGECEPCTNCLVCSRDGCLQCADGYEYFEERCVDDYSLYVYLILVIFIAIGLAFICRKSWSSCKEKLQAKFKGERNFDRKHQIPDEDKGFARNTQIELSEN